MAINTTCGIDINVNNMSGTLKTTIDSFLNLSGTIGKITGINALDGILGPGLNSIKDKVTTILPAIPNSIGNQSLLGDDLGSIMGSVNDFASGIGDFLHKYAGLTDLDAYVNIDLLDLANSVFDVSGSFDPCSILLPKIFADADGNLSEGAQSPHIGTAKAAGTKNMILQKVTDNFAAVVDNPVLPTIDSNTGFLNVSSVLDIVNGDIVGNIRPNFSLKGMTNYVKKLSTGENIFQTTNDYNRDSMRKAIGIGTKSGVLIDEDVKDFLEAPYLQYGSHNTPTSRRV